MVEITRRTFVEGKSIIAEEQDFKSRELSLDVRGWSSYCFFLTGRSADDWQTEIRKKLPQATIRAIESLQPPGVWLKGPRWELDAAIVALKL
ncbi:hypothetical protein [Kaistia sp. MMO-174]|uniref:hypothetical protein n=1 Tax=Kaistia sp. MMO-174 TaxID=3081256 RepID=UPI0030191816